MAIQGNYYGLSIKEAQKRLKEYGENIVLQKRKISLLADFLKKFSSPLMVILIIVSIISFFLGEHINAVIILVMVLLSSLLDFINTYRFGAAVEKLAAKVAITATVIRDEKLI